MVSLHFVYIFARCGAKYWAFILVKAFHFAFSALVTALQGMLFPYLKIKAFTSLVKAVIRICGFGVDDLILSEKKSNEVLV